MSTVAFITRDTSGTKQHGEFADASPALDATSAKDISLNLSTAEVQSYQRVGNDLQILTMDGQTLVLDNYFATGITGQKNLFLSDNGEFIEVVIESSSEGMLYPTYEPLDVSGKWSAYDELVFLELDRVEPVIAPLIAAPALGGLGAAAAAAGVVGAGALIGGGGDDDVAGGTGGGGNGGSSDGGDSGSVTPTVDDPDASYDVSGSTTDPVTITGTGAPGSEVEVTIGTETQTVIVDDDGTWTAPFDPSDLPDDGNYDVTVHVEDPDGETFDLDGPTINIDTTPPPIEVTDGTQSVGEVVNASEHSGGPVIAGQGEAGASIAVEINGTTHTTTVGDDGSWSVTFASGEIATGEYETTVTITSSDAFGNTTVVSDVLEVDTIAPPIGIEAVEGDDLINAAEASDGVVLSGTGEAGASISVDFMGEIATTTVGSDGTWSVGYNASVITAGEYDTTFTVSSTDAAGNTSTSSHDVTIDTVAPTPTINTVEGDDVVNAAEAADGITLSGGGEAGSAVSVTFLGTTRTTTVANDGTWSLDYASSAVPAGESTQVASVTMTDVAGNTGPTVTHSVEVDTLVDPLTADASQTADDIVNNAERASGLTLTGTVEAGSTVQVTINSITRTATVDASGNWSVNFEASDLPEGVYSESATIVATDAAGNTATISETFSVDTYGAPEYHGLETNSGNIEQLIFEEEITGMSVNTVADDGTVTAVSGVSQTNDVTDPFTSVVSTETSFFLSDPTDVPDGSRLVITGTDTAGNTADSLLILEDAVSGNILDNAGFSGFNIETLELDESADANITISEDDIKALSVNTDTLVVHGGSDDTITVTGVTAQETRTIDGENFNVYTVGSDGTTLIVEEDVNVII